MRRVSLFAVALVGCAGASQTRTANVSAPDARVDVLVARYEAAERRSNELETRLSMLEAEARHLRSEVAELSAAESRRSVRIGEGRRASRASADLEETREGDDVEVRESPAEPRVVLRLVGEPARPVATASVSGVMASTIPAPLPEVPVVTERLAVTGASRSAVPPIAAAGSLPSAAPADPVAEYRSALALVTAQEFSRAYEALSRFVERYPGHAHADNALYWRAEIWYLQGEYARAVREFDALVARFPAGAKAADALLRVAACHARLGNRAEAQAAIERIRRDYPSSDAARRASDRDAT